MLSTSKLILFTIFSLLLVFNAEAQHKGINFQASIKKPDGTMPTVSGVTVTAQILDPINNCVLREEEHQGKSINNGFLNLVLGDASATTPAARNPSPVLSITQVLDNKTTRNGLKCIDVNNNIISSNQTYVPSNLDRRVLRIRLNIQGDDVVADFNMRAVAFAVNSEMLNSKTDDDFVNINPSKGVTKANVESIFDRFTKLDSLLESTKLDGLLSRTNAAGDTLSVNISGNASTATSATTIVGGVNTLLPSQSGHTGKYLKTDGTTVSWESVSGGGSGLTQIGLNLPTSVFSNGADITANGQVSATFVNQSAKTFFAGPNSGSAVPSFRTITTSDVGSFDADVDTRADARITAAKNAASGIAGLDASTKIPLALLPNDAVFSSSVKTGVLKFIGPSSSEIQLSAPASGLTSYNILLPTSAGTAGQVLKIDSVAGSNLNLSWDTVTSSGGTLSSVGLSLPSALFDVANTPLIANGDITASLKNQNANLIFAGPTSGGAAAPGFRTLVAGDIPNLGWSQMTGVISSQQIAKHTPSFTANGLVVTGATNVAEPVVLSPCIGVVKSDASVFSCSPLLSTDLASNIIKSAHIEDGAVTNLKISGVIGSAKLPVASSSSDGIVNQIAQSFAGVKTFVNNLIAQGTLTVTGLLSANGGIATTSLSSSGQISADRIKLANSSAVCDASTEGSIRYNSTSKKMEFCNGTAWANISVGTLASLSVGAPSVSLTKSGPVTYDITYGSGVDTSTINLSGKVTIGGGGSLGCSITGISGTGFVRTVTVNGCTGTGPVYITIAANSAQSTTGESAPSVGASTSFNVDNVGPNAPTGVTLGAVPSNLTNSPTISYAATTDNGSAGVASYQVRIVRTSDSAVLRDWTNHTSGNNEVWLSLTQNTQYSVFVRAVDALGNNGTASTAVNWTSFYDPCSGSPTPGTVCAGGAIYLGSLSPGATSGSGTDRYMTTPGGCGDIPAGQIGGGAGSSAWPVADFTPASCSGTDSLTKYWNDGTSNWYDIPMLTNYTWTMGTGQGSTNIDSKYGSQNAVEIVAITDSNNGGYHAAARYCDKLVYGGYSDWYLPNRYELNLMFTNQASIPGLEFVVQYWSSTEYGNNIAWTQRMSDGSQNLDSKNNNRLVRCVRKF